MATLVGASEADQGIGSANRILETFGSVSALFEAGVEEIDQVTGGKGALVLAARDLALEAQRQIFLGSLVKHLDPSLHAYLIDTMGSLAEEQFRAIFVDENSHYIADEAISWGTGDELTVSGRRFFRRAFALGARGAILAHNHPSGDLRPSPSDIQVTRKLIEFGSFSELRILDHLIVGRRSVASMREMEVL